MSRDDVADYVSAFGPISYVLALLAACVAVGVKT